MADKIVSIKMNGKKRNSDPKVWFVYAILCSNNSVYIGQTSDLENRWKLHQKGNTAQWTKKYPPVRLFYHEKVPSRIIAMKRELELKKTKGRRMLKKMVKKERMEISL